MKRGSMLPLLASESIAAVGHAQQMQLADGGVERLLRGLLPPLGGLQIRLALLHFAERNAFGLCRRSRARSKAALIGSTASVGGVGGRALQQVIALRLAQIVADDDQQFVPFFTVSPSLALISATRPATTGPTLAIASALNATRAGAMNVGCMTCGYILATVMPNFLIAAGSSLAAGGSGSAAWVVAGVVAGLSLRRAIPIAGHRSDQQRQQHKTQDAPVSRHDIAFKSGSSVLPQRHRDTENTKTLN